jgi:hypothetical protein
MMAKGKEDTGSSSLWRRGAGILWMGRLSPPSNSPRIYIAQGGKCSPPKPETGIGGVVNKKVTSRRYPQVLARRGRCFLSMTIGDSGVAIPIITVAAVWSNHRTPTSNSLSCSSNVLYTQINRFVLVSYRGTSVLLCGISFISVVEPQFLLCIT